MKANAETNKDTTIEYPTPDGDAQSTALTATVLTDTNATWTNDEWIDCKLNPNANETSPDPYETYAIVDNTATTITVEGGSDMTTHAEAGDYYEIFDPADPEFTAEWLRGLSWANYKPKAVDTGAPGTPQAYSFNVK